MPYIDNPNFVWPETITYDVLVQDPDGTQTLLTGQPDAGSLYDSAEAAVEAHRTETGADVTLVDAWISGGRVFATTEPGPVPMRPVTTVATPGTSGTGGGSPADSEQPS